MHNFHIWLHVCSPRFSQEILCNSHGCEKFPALRSCIKALAFSASNIFELWTPVLTDFSGPRSVNKILSNTHRPCQVYVVVVVVVQVWTSLTFSFFLVILFVSILIYVLSFRIFKRRTCFLPLQVIKHIRCHPNSENFFFATKNLHLHAPEDNGAKGWSDVGMQP